MVSVRFWAYSSLAAGSLRWERAELAVSLFVQPMGIARDQARSTSCCVAVDEIGACTFLSRIIHDGRLTGNRTLVAGSPLSWLPHHATYGCLVAAIGRRVMGGDHDGTL
jgi:hypothetical protein